MIRIHTQRSVLLAVVCSTLCSLAPAVVSAEDLPYSSIAPKSVASGSNSGATDVGDDPLPPWKDHTLPVAKRISDLLFRLSDLDQLNQLGNSAAAFLDQPRYEYGQECLAGFDGGNMFCAQTDNIPTIATSAFAHAVSLGMTFDPTLVRSVAAAIASEARAAHTHLNRPSLTCLSPVLNIARDPRWGRSMECYSEDPTIVARLGAAYVTGIQKGDVTAPESDILLMSSAPKHFGDYNLECTCTEPQRNGSICNASSPYPNCRAPYGMYRSEYDAKITAHDMRETYLAGWRAAAAAGATGAMCSYNAVNGVPTCADSVLQNDILRTEFGFKGWIVSDADAVANIYTQPTAWSPQNPGGQPPGHFFAHDYVGAAAAGMNGGCDISFECPDVIQVGAGYVNGTLRAALEADKVKWSTIEAAVVRTLTSRFRTGLYDPPATNPWQLIPLDVIQSEEHTELAVRCAVESATLLKNENNTLPLLPAEGVEFAGPGIIGVVGMAATDIYLAIDRYNGRPDDAHVSTFFDGISDRAAMAGAVVVGCNSTLSNAVCAQNLAEQGAVHVIVVTSGHDEGESHDRADIGLPDDQVDLISRIRVAMDGKQQEGKVHALRPRITLVLVSGGATSTERVDAMVDATVWIGKPGMQAGNGFAKLLYGDEDFSGRLSVTVYKEAWTKVSNFLSNAISGNLTNQPRGYRYNTDTALVQYPFGSGLSYMKYSTKFRRAEYSISAAELMNGSSVVIDATLTNIAAPATLPELVGKRSVLLYLQGDTDATPLPRRLEWLADFVKIHGVTPRASVPVALRLDADALSRWVPVGGAESQAFTEGSYRVVKGKYTMRLSDGTETATLSVV